MYDFKAVEKKWQDKWDKDKSFCAVDFHPTKPKYYVLYEFFNISGNLHMGHLKGSVPADALARMKRLQGYNVLFPIGGDSFGLPAENAALKTGIDPKEFVANGMKNAMAQSKQIGLSFDYDRAFCTSDEDYYKWTQWIFLKLFENGKAYKQKGVVNYCPNCKTVLSNEDSQGGICDRCHGKVVQKEKNVWFLKMKEYSEKLLGNVDRIEMNENLKELQRNWIGRSEGMQVTFDIVDHSGKKLTTADIFTTCIETIYGITFMVMAPEHHLIKELAPSIKNIDEVKTYQEQTTYRSEFDRLSNQKDKTGCLLDGIYAVNPVNGKRVPIYIADFVLCGYGTGMVMAVPTHDQRDYDFAKEFNIPLITVIENDKVDCAYEKADYLKQNPKMVNSQEFSGMKVLDAKHKIAEKLIAMGKGKKVVNYKMQDWSFNRQRYWGEPFPIVFCDKCGVVAVDEKELPSPCQKLMITCQEMVESRHFQKLSHGSTQLVRTVEVRLIAKLIQCQTGQAQVGIGSDFAIRTTKTHLRILKNSNIGAKLIAILVEQNISRAMFFMHSFGKTFCMKLALFHLVTHSNARWGVA